MRVVAITEPGPPDVLNVEHRAEPEPGADQVLVEVSATALNRADLLQRRGQYPAPAGIADDVPGLEFSGVVALTGDKAGRFATGDRVMGLLGGGGYAEQIAVEEDLVMRVPDGLSDIEAAAVPEAFLTAFDALILQAELQPDETVLIHACGSGVGSAAVQLAVLQGAVVLGTAGSEGKLERAAELGLTHGINYREEELTAAVRRRLAERGCDVILDLVGQANWPQNLEVLALRGRIVVVGLVSGGEIALDLRQLMSRRARVFGTVLRSRSLAEKAQLVTEFTRRALPGFDTGRLRPVVDCTFPLEQAADAHRYMESNQNFGKIVLTVAAGG